jgi:hypothetical protein
MKFSDLQIVRCRLELGDIPLRDPPYLVLRSRCHREHRSRLLRVHLVPRRHPRVSHISVPCVPVRHRRSGFQSVRYIKRNGDTVNPQLTGSLLTTHVTTWWRHSNHAPVAIDTVGTNCLIDWGTSRTPPPVPIVESVWT